MANATLTSKGQITIPISVRNALGLETGSRVEFVQDEHGQFSMVPITSTIKELKGSLKKPKKAVSIKEMNRIIAARGAKVR